MALLKVYTQVQNYEQLRNNVAQVIKLICSAALNCDEIPTAPSNIEMVYCEGIDLVNIDYIIEIIACRRKNLEKISQKIVSGLNAVYPDKHFSVYFNLIEEDGMANTPRKSIEDKPISIEEAIKISRSIN